MFLCVYVILLFESLPLLKRAPLLSFYTTNKQKETEQIREEEEKKNAVEKQTNEWINVVSMRFCFVNFFCLLFQAIPTESDVRLFFIEIRTTTNSMSSMVKFRSHWKNCNRFLPYDRFIHSLSLCQCQMIDDVSFNESNIICCCCYRLKQIRDGQFIRSNVLHSMA